MAKNGILAASARKRGLGGAQRSEAERSGTEAVAAGGEQGESSEMALPDVVASSP